MKCRIEMAPWRDGYDITFYADGPGTRHAAKLVPALFEGAGPTLMWAQLPEGVRPEPTITLDRDALEALLEAAGGVVRSGDQPVDALQDARQVRDRMITLVETLAVGPPTEVVRVEERRP